MKYLITGASGYIGSYTTQYLLEKGFEVTAVSRHFPERLKLILSSATLIEQDILTEGFFSIKTSADVCIHFATANDMTSREGLQGLELSVVGTKKMLEYCIQNNIKNFIYGSTFRVYGMDLEGLISENTPIKPENDYALFHLFAEQYIEMYCRKHSINCSILRFSNVYGVPITKEINRWSLVPLCFCKEIYESNSITLQSSGIQMRNFVSLETISMVCEAIGHSKPVGFNIFNVGSKLELSILSAARLVKSIYEQRYNKNAQLNIKSSKTDTPNISWVSLEGLRSFGISVQDSADNFTYVVNGIFDLLEG